MAGFDNDVMYATNVDFSGSTTPAATVLLDGQLLIGATASPNIRVNTLTAGAGITITNGTGSITIAASGGLTPVAGLIPDAHTAPGTTPVVGDGSGDITITGAQVAAGVVGTNVIRTDSLAANTMTIEIQRATSAAVSTPADNGVAHFDSAIFTVGAGGYVSLVGGAVPPTQKFAIDGSTPPGTNPVVPTAGGIVTVSGGQTLAGVVGTNAIRTFSSAANELDIQIQRANTSASSNVVNNGISHYDSAIFTIDANAFVSLKGGSVPPAQKFTVDTSSPPGTNPVVPTASGVVIITGNQIPAASTPNAIRTDSIAANQITVEVQRSAAVAISDVTKNGICHFNSAQFTVDSNGYVSSSVTGAGGRVVSTTFTATGPFTYVPTVNMVTCIIELVGGGGGSGGVQGGGISFTTGGSGAGFLQIRATAAQIGASASGVVGVGGAGGAAGVNAGTNGANSTITISSGTPWVATGGVASGGGSTGSGNFTYAPTPSAPNTLGTNATLIKNIIGGQGGISWGNGGVGGFAGSGGSSPQGFGYGGSGGSAISGFSALPQPGTGYGSGGGGPAQFSGANQAGVAGQNGIVVVYEFISG